MNYIINMLYGVLYTKISFNFIYLNYSSYYLVNKKSMVNIKNHIKNHDLFGYRVDLNFNKRGHSHQTMIGGLISILLKVLIILYVWYLY